MFKSIFSVGRFLSQKRKTSLTKDIFHCGDLAPEPSRPCYFGNKLFGKLSFETFMQVRYRNVYILQ